MAFTDFSAEFQNVLLQNFDLSAKYYIIFSILAFSLIYLFYWKPNKEEQTPYWSVGIVRLVATKSSQLFLLCSPFFILYFTPQNTIWNLFGTLLNIYLPIFLIVLIFSVMEFWHFGFHYILNAMGMKTDDPKVKLFLRKINKRGRFQ